MDTDMNTWIKNMILLSEIQDRDKASSYFVLDFFYTMYYYYSFGDFLVNEVITTSFFLVESKKTD